MGCCGSTANVPPEDLTTQSTPVRSVAPPVPVSRPPPTISEPSTTLSRIQSHGGRNRTRTQSTHHSTHHGKEGQDPSSRPRTLSAPGKVQTTRSSSSSQPPLPQDRRTRAQTLDTRGKSNRSGPRPPNPGESGA